MATLCVNGGTRAAALLRDWLAGDWALLFSHPEDFQDKGLEADRWLEILRAEFRARGVRPVACRRNPMQLDASWISALDCDGRVLWLEGDAGPTDDEGHSPARSLREDILGMPPRFVMIIDDSLQRRGVLKYSPGHSSVSPLDLLASIDALRYTRRRRSSARKAA